jgi:transcriptional regulator with XRE-family HTH domain
MEIGSKIRQSRKEAKITQEQAAEALGVSRQTISNWENEKSYPDIISVLKMSDLYNVSLDYLLKGESAMNSYVDYLDESTNVVKSRKKFSKLILILSYLVIWAVAVIVFWCFTGEEDAMGYSLMFLWIILPAATFVVSLLISRNNFWGRYKWLGSAGFGFMYMLGEYATFSMANNAAFGRVNAPDLSMMAAGTVISLMGMGIGHLLHMKNK